MKVKLFILTAIFIALFCSNSFGVFTLTANINSYYPLTAGPTMPFPRFINYTAGGTTTLYTLSDWRHQPAGVAHAEMEKWLRDAWQMYLNSWEQIGTTTINYQLANGTAVAVPLYVDSSWMQNANNGVSEGHGYALLMAAQMADKNAFDSLWFWINENGLFNNTKIYSTGVVVDPTYQYGAHVPAWSNAGSDSATDGDVDTAMGALIAWKQWGDNTGYYAAGGSGTTTLNSNNLPAIQYKEMALDSIRFLVGLSGGPSHATAVNAWATGDVGFDGYHKSGNTWGEMTNFVAPSGTGGTCGPVNGPVSEGATTTYYDYTGPSYWHCFASTLINNGDPIDNNNTTLDWCNGTGTGNWNVSQLQKVASSSAWLQSQLTANYTFPVAGQVAVAGTAATFTNFNEGEDFRSIWRQTLDYMLYGNPPAANTWDPTNHTIDGSTPNTAEYNAALKVYNFFKNYATCYQPGTYGLTFNIPEMIWSNYTLAGVPMSTTDHIPYLLGTATAAVIIGANVNNDFLFMERWYRELSTLWDDQVDNGNGNTIQTGYLACYPKYFHDFFRMLGLMMITGNYVDPCNWVPQANMKVYKSVYKTYAFPNDLVTFWINYRNYASVNAANVVITDTLPNAFTFVSAGTTGAPTVSGQTVSWNIGTVDGLQQQNYAGTEGGVTLVVQVLPNAALGHYCNYADISCSNGTGWTSNICPNEVSYVMRRNCVDIVTAALSLTKTASVSWASIGQAITYTLNYCDSSQAGWLNGGRPGAIFSIAETEAPTTDLIFILRGMHSASEPWIDWGNYRFSYFLYSQGQGWNLIANDVEGTSGVSVTTESLVPGCTNGNTQCWDERVIIKNNTSVTMPSHLLMKFFNNMPNMHYPDGDVNYGGTGTNSPLLITYDIETNPFVTTHNWSLDYSSLPATGAYAYGTTSSILYPISPDWTAGDGTSVTVPQVNRDSCNGTNPAITNVLIEEWDGYCWRRVYGNGPQPGRELTNVILTDSLPTALTWGGFIGNTLATYTSSSRTIQWNIGNMLVNQCGQLQYWATAAGLTCPSPSTITAVNTAFIAATNEAPIADSAIVSITCNAPPPSPPPSSLTKTANAASFATGSNITYTINYTNLNGTVINSAANNTILSSAANWTLDSGTANTYATGGITIASGTDKSHYNYSYGTNGQIITSINMTNNSSYFGVYFRGTMSFTMQVCGIGTSCPIALWNGTTAVATANYSFNSMNLDLRIDLIGATVNIYLKDRSQANWNPLPTISYTTAPVTAGYAGIISGTPGGSGSNGSQQFISWYTSLDNAFNTLIYDTIPTGVSFVSASNSGAVVSGAVQWPLIAQMTYGQSISYTWVGTITANCTMLYNSAYAAPMGVTYAVGSQMYVTITCGTAVPTKTSTTGPSPTFTWSPTLTNSPTPSDSPTMTNTPTFTSTPTNTPTRTPTPSSTNTASPTPTYTPTPSNTASPTKTSTLSPTYTCTNSPTPTLTPSPSFTPSPSPTFTYTPTRTNSPTLTYTPTSTNTLSPTYTNTASPTNTVTSSLTLTPTPSFTPSPSPTLTYTPTRTSSPTYTYTPTGTSTASPSPTSTASPTSTNTVSPSYTSTLSATPTSSPTYTPTSSITPTYTITMTFTIVIISATITPTYTISPTSTDTKTITPSDTPTSTYTSSATLTYSVTSSMTNTPSPTFTDTPTYTYTLTSTSTYTITLTFTPPIYSPTITPTYTLTSTMTDTPTFTYTPTYTASPTFTSTLTVTDTVQNPPTLTDTATWTPTYTDTPTYTETLTYTITLTPTPSFTASPTLTYTDTRTDTDTPTATYTSTPTFTDSPVDTLTNTATDSPTQTNTPTFTSTPTQSYTRTVTLTCTPTPTFTGTRTYTDTATQTDTYTFTFTSTSTYTFTQSPTITSTYTITSTPNVNSTVVPTISLGMSGDNPKVGAKITFTLVVDNTSNTTISNISIWDTLPGEVSLLGVSLPSQPTPTVDGNYIDWSLTGTAGTLQPGQSLIIQFTVTLNTYNPANTLISNVMSVDYNDPFYNTIKHPPLTSNVTFYPVGKVVVYPNPYNPNRAFGGTLKFENVVPGTSIQIYTISGELVDSIETNDIVAYWNGKNRYGDKVSAGIYYFVLSNPDSGTHMQGKIFLIYQ